MLYISIKESSNYFMIILNSFLEEKKTSQNTAIQIKNIDLFTPDVYYSL